jgi:hypothetical protein
VPPAPTASLPIAWFTKPFNKALKKVVRPATANRRRKEIHLKMPMPREAFESIVSPLTEADVEGLERDADGHLKPTKTTVSLNYYKYTIKKGSVSARLFHLDTLDPPPKPLKPPKRKAEEITIGAEEDVYEVEEIREKRLKPNGKGSEYLIKWRDWPEETNTWESAHRINKADVAAFEGRPLKVAAPSRPSLPARGVGCARAQLSSAEQARGGKPETISMVCGEVVMELKEPKRTAPRCRWCRAPCTCSRWTRRATSSGRGTSRTRRRPSCACRCALSSRG